MLNLILIVLTASFLTWVVIRLKSVGRAVDEYDRQLRAENE